MTPTNDNKARKAGLTAKGDQRQYVKHSYKDRSNDIIDNLTTSDENTLRLYQEDSVGGPFPLKLQIVLKVTEKLGQQHIISWLPHGRSFMIHRPREFETEIMGKFFKQTKLTSFRRQLNLYDFQRITHGRDAGSYYHELFLRGRPLLAKRMIRRKVKGTKIRASSSPDDEPNFYNMPYMGTLNDFPNSMLGAGMGAGMGHGAMGMMGHHDPTFAATMGAGGGGYHSLGRFPHDHHNGNLGFGGMHGSMRGSLNPQDHHSLLQHQHNQAQHQAALAALHPSAAAFQQQQNALYSDFMNPNSAANRMHGLNQPYGAGAMDNFNYANALGPSSTLPNNHLACSSFAMSNERHLAQARLDVAANNPSILNNRDAALLGDGMSGMRNLQSAAAAAGRDPRYGQLPNDSYLGVASSQLSGAAGGGYPNHNVPGSAFSSMMNSSSSMAGAGGGGMSGSNMPPDFLNTSLTSNSTSVGGGMNRQSFMMQQMQQENYSQLLRSPQHLAMMSSVQNQRTENGGSGRVRAMGGEVDGKEYANMNNGQHNLSFIATAATETKDGEERKESLLIENEDDDEDGEEEGDDDDEEERVDTHKEKDSSQKKERAAKSGMV